MAGALCDKEGGRKGDKVRKGEGREVERNEKEGKKKGKGGLVP